MKQAHPAHNPKKSKQRSQKRRSQKAPSLGDLLWDNTKKFATGTAHVMEEVTLNVAKEGAEWFDTWLEVVLPPPNDEYGGWRDRR
ncbi:MAG: hypothetical protein ACE5JQ_00645 [Candidatus Methylomirabilales bacterium]